MENRPEAPVLTPEQEEEFDKFDNNASKSTNHIRKDVLGEDIPVPQSAIDHLNHASSNLNSKTRDEKMAEERLDNAAFTSLADAYKTPEDGKKKL